MSIRKAARLILSRLVECRNDDQLLFAQVQGFCPGANPMTIVRYRAEYQNDLGWFLPADPDVLKRRNRHKRRRNEQQ
jgi:hypothetical protein